MERNSQDSWSIEAIGAFGQSVNSNAAYSAPATLTPSAPAVKKIRVPRPLNDQVSLSREARDEGASDSLCANFMAAWG